ncbi:hypothetical protein ACWGLB_01595 [Streptomyces sp. NPDC055893]
MSEEPKTYDASTIVVLEGLEAVRKRPRMYIGSVGERGLHHLVLEAAERALKEILGGAASCVEITLTADGSVRVTPTARVLRSGAPATPTALRWRPG